MWICEGCALFELNAGWQFESGAACTYAAGRCGWCRQAFPAGTRREWFCVPVPAPDGQSVFG